jgi:hypothetical protein
VPNVTAKMRHAWLDESALLVMRKQLKLSPEGGNSSSKKCKGDYYGVCGEVCRSLRLAGIWSQAVGSFGVFAEIWLKSPCLCFLNLGCFIKEVHKRWISNAICKKNASKIILLLKHQKDHFHQNLRTYASDNNNNIYYEMDGACKPYYEPDEFRPHLQTCFSWHIHCCIILPATLVISSRPFVQVFQIKFMFTSFLSQSTCSAHLIIVP